MNKKVKVIVIGCGVSPECISSRARDRVLHADVIAGGKRLLDLFPEFKGEKIAITSKISDFFQKIKSLSKSETVAILASGDPLFHGIGAAVEKYFKKNEYEIIPNVSAMQSLFAKIKITWDGAKLLSIHGGRKINFRTALASSISVIYCDDKITASNLAAKFAENFPPCGKRPAVIAENLGMENEKIETGTIFHLARKKCGALSILLLLPSTEITDEGIALGLPDSNFIHENRMITHSEIRAIVLSKLKIGHGAMWDLGAASGSVGIEAASLCPDLKVYAAESNRKRFLQMKKNAEKFGLSNYSPYHIDSKEFIGMSVPRPRCVFVGGGGKDISEIVKKTFCRLLPGGRLVVAAVMLETKAELTKCLKNNFIEAVTISISRSSSLGKGRLMKSENSVDIFVYEKKM
jgi:precorrin-6Y C5,15-methyltransferase (decarboxylating)